MKKKIIIIISVVLLLGISVYFYLNNSTYNNKKFKLEDYLIIDKLSKEDILDTSEEREAYTSFDFSKVSFINIDNKLINEFIEKQDLFINQIKNYYIKAKDAGIDTQCEDWDYENNECLQWEYDLLWLEVVSNVNAEIKNNILEVNVTSKLSGGVEIEKSNYSVKINLNKIKN